MSATLVYNEADGSTVFRLLEGEKMILAFRKMDGGNRGKLFNIRVYENDDPQNFLGRIQKTLDEFSKENP